MDSDEISKFYNEAKSIWRKEDWWHQYTHRMILKFIQNQLIVDNNDIILNAGSGGENYGIPEDNLLHVDIAEERLRGLSNSILCSIESLTIEDNSVNKILCVGSVINYCDAMTVLLEFERVLTPCGVLILEFEKSDTSELYFSKDWNKKVVLRETFFHDQNIKIWYYSESYILETLKSLSFEVIKIRRFHLVSSFVLKITKRPKFSSLFRFLDPIIRIVPFLRKGASNAILYAIKN